MQSFSCINWQLDIRCVVLRHREQKGALSAKVTNDGTERLLFLEMANWNAITCNGGVEDDCVKDTDLQTALTWTTAVDLQELIRSFVFHPLLLGSVVVCTVFDEPSLCHKFVKEVARCARSWIKAVSFDFQHEHMLC